ARPAGGARADLRHGLPALLCGERQKLVPGWDAEVSQGASEVADDAPGAGVVTALRGHPETGGEERAGDLLPRSLREFRIVGEEGLPAGRVDRPHHALGPLFPDPLEEN